jgi:hypothetical protein
LLCYYVAQNPEQIYEHSRQSNIPCDDVVEVTEVLPEVYASAIPVVR